MMKTIAQMAIMNWIESHIEKSGLDIKFTDKREAYIKDKNGDCLTLIYYEDTKEVYAI